MEEKVESLSGSSAEDKTKTNMMEQPLILEGETHDEMVDMWKLDENFSEEMFDGDREQTKLIRSQKVHGPVNRAELKQSWNCLQWS